MFNTKKPFTNLEAHTLPLYIHQHLAGIARSISHGEGIAAYFIAKSLIPDRLSFRENIILISLYSLISFKSKGNISAKKVSPTSSETERIKIIIIHFQSVINTKIILVCKTTMPRNICNWAQWTQVVTNRLSRLCSFTKSGVF